MATNQNISLPIDAVLPEVIAALAAHDRLIIEAAPGAGKTTRVPRALCEAGFGPIVVLEPRRLAARLSAERVASEWGEKVGGRVGYRVRFEDVTSERTELTFLTEGLFLRMLAEPRSLDAIRTVVIDEFHERHLPGDVALALVRARKNAKLVIMSATLDGEKVAERLDAKLVRAAGRVFPVAIEFAAQPVAHEDLPRAVATAVRKAVNEGLTGHVLVFLAGMDEIRRVQTACARIIEEAPLELLVLHGELPKEEQARVFADSGRRKLILSTNVAETSVTIDGVEVVVDGGTHKSASHSPWSGLPLLQLVKASRSSLDQRAGRAGRTRPGRAIRLYTRHDYETRAAEVVPELLRSDLAEPVLLLASLGFTDAAALPWYDPPPQVALENAAGLLRALAAVEKDAAALRVTPLGKKMIDLGLSVRAARALIAAVDSGLDDAALLGALLSEGALGRASERVDRQRQLVAGPSDLLADVDHFRDAQAVRFSADHLRRNNLDIGRVKQVARLVDRLERKVASLKNSGARAKTAPRTAAAHDEVFLRSLLAAFPDRVAKRRKPGAKEILLAAGGQAQLSPTSVVVDAPWLLALEADVYRRSDGRPSDPGVERQGSVTVTRASAIEPDWLLEQFPDEIVSASELVWNDGQKRVEKVESMRYGTLPIIESKGAPSLATADEQTEAAKLLADAARRLGVAQLFEMAEVEQLFERLRFLSEHSPDLLTEKLTAPSAAQYVEELLPRLCVGKSQVAELTTHDLLAYIGATLPAATHAQIIRLVPEDLRLASGRRLKIKYAHGQPPFAESRLQDFFGMTKTPTVINGRVAVVLHLLAPNQRAVQVTSDLEGFWARTYPDVRKELSRRYPRHHWPEDPLNPGPPPPRRPR